MRTAVTSARGHDSTGPSEVDAQSCRAMSPTRGEELMRARAGAGRTRNG